MNKKGTVKFRKRRFRFKRIFLILLIGIGVPLILINFLSLYFLDVSLISLGSDALAISGLTGPTIEEIKELPVEEVNKNVKEFIEVFNKEGNPPEKIELEEGLTGIRVVKEDIIIEELTIEVKNGEIVSVDYSGLPEGISEEDIAVMPENMFKIIFGPGLPESLPGALETYSKARGG